MTLQLSLHSLVYYYITYLYAMARWTCIHMAQRLLQYASQVTYNLLSTAEHVEKVLKLVNCYTLHQRHERIHSYGIESQLQVAILCSQSTNEYCNTCMGQLHVLTVN